MKKEWAEEEEKVVKHRFAERSQRMQKSLKCHWEIADLLNTFFNFLYIYIAWVWEGGGWIARKVGGEDLCSVRKAGKWRSGKEMWSRMIGITSFSGALIWASWGFYLVFGWQSQTTTSTQSRSNPASISYDVHPSIPNCTQWPSLHKTSLSLPSSNNGNRTPSCWGFLSIKSGRAHFWGTLSLWISPLMWRLYERGEKGWIVRDMRGWQGSREWRI